MNYHGTGKKIVNIIGSIKKQHEFDWETYTIYIYNICLHVQGEKDITITDANNFNLILPTLEYHSRTWTWQDLVQAVKKDYKLTLVPQVSETGPSYKFYLFTYCNAA